MKLFTNDREAVFVRRPNRFLIIARDGEEELPCHCPNPGRLIEFALPGTRLILERRRFDKPRSGSAPKTGWTAAGLYYRNAVVPLFSSRANQAAEKLILKNLIPGLREITPEYTIGSSRFDFLCTGEGGSRHLVEVKACSLIEYGTAMFPDAPSGRARKHLEELADLSERGFRCHVLFVIVHSRPRVFIPNLHTDPLFAAALSRLAGKVEVHGALLRCDPAGEAVLAAKSVPVDLSHGELAERDCGNYLILGELREGEAPASGFRPGWYVYAGSAPQDLSRRVNRYLRRGRRGGQDGLENLIRKGGGVLKSFPIFSYRDLSRELWAALEALGGEGVPGFALPEAPHRSRLHYFSHPPLADRNFVDTLLRFRHREGLQRPGQEFYEENEPRKTRRDAKKRKTE
ncbi:MAG: DNA/RNA nuclease SfsA [Spirochaetales bacterium]|nr:DNA/RNA nuclease SfsA [Spirochaetales bacterium]